MAKVECGMVWTPPITSFDSLAAKFIRNFFGKWSYQVAGTTSLVCITELLLVNPHPLRWFAGCPCGGEDMDSACEWIHIAIVGEII